MGLILRHVHGPLGRLVERGRRKLLLGNESCVSPKGPGRARLAEHLVIE